MYMAVVRRRVIRALFAAVVALGIVALPGVAGAHTGFDSSVPADGDSVDAPVDAVTISFTATTTPTADGFVALDGDGTVRTPNAIETEDNLVYVLRFDPPLAGGDIGVRWSVRAEDGHTIEGAFAFAVTAPLPTTAPATTVPPATEPPVSEPAATEPSATDAPPDSSAATTTATTEPAATTSTSPAVAEVADAAPPDAAATVSLDEFLAVDDSQPGETTALIGRVLGFLGVALTLGGLGFVATTLRGPRSEITWLLTAAGGAGIVLAVGALIEYVGVSGLVDESLGATWTTSAGFATLLRLVGALAIILGLVITVRRAEFQPPATPRPLSAAVIEDAGETAPTVVDGGRTRWRPTLRAWPLAAGVAVIVASFWFDGHTVSKGFRPLHAAVNSIHVLAGSIWVGGVVALCATLLARRRAGRRSGAAELVVRFSRIATVALAAVVAAGAVMAFVVLDSFADLTGTEWGQTLLLKTAAVAVAIAIGAYNHFRLVPALDADPESARLAARLRSTLVAESIVLLFVVIVTAWLVVGATT